MSKEKNNKKRDNKYNSNNEIIIGVTTKSKEEVRVEKKNTRTKVDYKKNVKSNNKKVNSKKTKKVSDNKRNKDINTKIKKKNKAQNAKLEVEVKKLNKKRIVLSIVFLIAIMLGGTIYYLTTPTFNIKSIEIYGNNKNSVDTYISLSKINIDSTNIFAITNRGIQKNLKENTYVEKTVIKRRLPNTIEIYITERTVEYQIEYSNKYIYLDNQGYILEINEEKKEVSVLKGLLLQNENIKIGQRLNNDDLIKLEVASKIVDYCKYNDIEYEIENIDLTDSLNYVINFVKEKKVVYLGNAANLVEKMDSAINIIKNEKGKKGKVFVQEDLINRNRPYFREDK